MPVKNFSTFGRFWPALMVAGVGVVCMVIAGQPETPARPPEAPAAAGLGQRPTPTMAKRSASGLSLKPLAQHRRLGAVYQVIRARSITLTASIAGLQTSPQNLLGYGVARVPLEAAGDGSMGAVLVAGQFQLPWTSVMSAEALQSWSTTSGGPLNLEENPNIVVTVRNAVETRQTSRDEMKSSYLCTVIADVTINGITTESTLPQTVLTFARQSVGDTSVKGDQLGIRARWRIFLNNFVSTMPGGGAPPVVDVNVDLLLSTVPPELQGDVPVTTDATPDASDQPADAPPPDAPPASKEPK